MHELLLKLKEREMGLFRVMIINIADNRCEDHYKLGLVLGVKSNYYINRA